MCVPFATRQWHWPRGAALQAALLGVTVVCLAHAENGRPAAQDSTLQPAPFTPLAPASALNIRDLGPGSIPLSIAPPPPAFHVIPTYPPPPAVDESAFADAPAPTVAGTADLGPNLQVSPDALRDDSADSWLRPRRLVHPKIPEKIIRQRKIDQTVVLSANVGADGRVREVRVRHAARDCDECTQSAVAAARGYIYESPGSKAGRDGVWATIKMRFSVRP